MSKKYMNGGILTLTANLKLKIINFEGQKLESDFRCLEKKNRE